jgi:hypothetical protein
MEWAKIHLDSLNARFSALLWYVYSRRSSPNSDFHPHPSELFVRTVKTGPMAHLNVPCNRSQFSTRWSGGPASSGWHHIVWTLLRNVVWPAEKACLSLLQNARTWPVFSDFSRSNRTAENGLPDGDGGPSPLFSGGRMRSPVSRSRLGECNAIKR